MGKPEDFHARFCIECCRCDCLFLGEFQKNGSRLFFFGEKNVFELMPRYFHAMLERGFYFAPSQFEAGFLSSAHRAEDVATTIEAARAVMGSL